MLSLKHNESTCCLKIHIKKIIFSQFARQLNGSPLIPRLCSQSFLSLGTDNTTQVAWCVLHSYSIQHQNTPLQSVLQSPSFSSKEREQAIHTIENRKTGKREDFFKGNIFKTNFLCPRYSINCVNMSLGTYGRKIVIVFLYNILKSHWFWDTIKFSQKIRETLEFLKLMLVVGTRKISLFLRLHIYLFFFQGDQLKAPYFVSKQWGSFFVDRLPGLENAEETLVRTWSCKCISTYSTIAIPSLEAIAGKEDGFFFFFF